MNIKLSDHFTYKKLLKFTFPSVIMMVILSIYGIVDGLFVSNFAGKTAFSAVNLIWPFVMMAGTIGFMFGSGGNAIISKTLGQGNRKKANELFSLFVYLTIFCGIIIGIVGIIFMEKIAYVLGARGEMLSSATLYGRIVFLGLPAFMLELEFQTFYSTAEKPTLGLVTTICSGVTNIISDAVLVAVLKLGIKGAGIATIVSQYVGMIVEITYFSRKNKSLLKLTKTHWYGRDILDSIINGSSELMNNLSMSFVSMLYNYQLLRYAGENGVASYGVIMYVNLIFLSVFIGYSMGVSPIVGYNFGAENHGEKKSVLKKSIVIIGVSSLLMFLSAELLASPLSSIFVGYDKELFELTKRGFFIYSFEFLFVGYAIFFSSFFTALSDGLTSALISFLRTLVFEILAVMLLPLVLGVDGIWLSVVVAEFTASAFSFMFLFIKRKRFQYF